MVREYLPYLSSDFTSTLNLFNSEVYGFKHAVPRWEKCSALVHDIMGLAVESALETKDPVTKTTTTTVHKMFEELKETVQQRLSMLEISSPLHKYLDQKLNKLQIQQNQKRKKLLKNLVFGTK